MTPSLRKKVLGAAAGGAVAIAGTLLGGHDGFEGRKYIAYNDVVGVMTLCDGHTGNDIIQGKLYSDQQCDALLQQDLLVVKKSVDDAIQVPVGELHPRSALFIYL